MSKILILKNDRAGDLFTSLKLISTLCADLHKVSIYLSELNFSFNFLFKNQIVKKINYDLTILDKLKILYDIVINNYDKIYILSPKSFYFLLPFVFRNIKFTQLFMMDLKEIDQINFRKFIFKYRVVSRKILTYIVTVNCKNN